MRQLVTLTAAAVLATAFGFGGATPSFAAVDSVSALADPGCNHDGAAGRSCVAITATPVIAAAPASVVLGVNESDTLIKVFDEQQSVVLGSSLAFDQLTDITPGEIAQGTCVNSHYIHFDNVGESGKRGVGSATFDAPIIGLLTSDATLDATDATLGAGGTTYDNGLTNRGLEQGAPTWNFQDIIFDVSGDTLSFDLQVFNVFDGLRVITECAEEPGLSKEVTSGPDVDGDSEIDVVIEVGQGASTAYDFTITYIPGEEAGALVVDTVPAEWDVIGIDEDGTGLPLACGESTSFDVNALTGTDVDVFRGGKSGKSCRSANEIEWKPDPGEEVSTLLVDVTTRINPGKGHGKPGHGGDIFSPTSCGPLFLNDGAVAFELDAQMNLVLDPPVTGDPVILPDGTTDPLCLAAVENPGTSPGDRGPNADTDGDGLTDLAEACQLGTNPCVFNDEDGDGVGDGFDLCPGTTQEQIDSGQVDGDGCHPGQLS